MTLGPKEPFRGLEPYRFVDRAVFFEREAETRKLLQLTTIYRASLMYGESGAGKSSLINAGFLPEVLKNKMAPERIRVQPIVDNEFIVERIQCSADGGFLPSLLAGDEQRRALSAPFLLSKIRDLGSAQIPMLIFDQFEEFHTLASDEGGQRTRDAVTAQERIIEALVELIRDPKIQARLLFVFREDYLAKFDRLFYLCPELPDHFVRLSSPAAASIREILRGPFTTNRLTQPFWDREISSELAEQIEAHLQPADGRATINLPQVQIVALQLWRADDPAEVLRKRGVGGLIDDYLESALTPFGRDRAFAESLLTFMITRQGTRKVLLEADACDQAMREEKMSSSKAAAILARLVGTRLVRRDFSRNAVSYEIVSEFLVPWIRTLKIQRESRLARIRWLKRAAFTFALATIILVAIFGWRYRATTVEAQAKRLVESYKHQTDVAESSRREAQRRADEALHLLKANGDEQVRKLSDDLAVLQDSSDKQKGELNKLAQQLNDSQKALAESRNEASTLISEVAKLKQDNKRLKEQIDAMPTQDSSKPQVQLKQPKTLDKGFVLGSALASHHAEDYIPDAVSTMKDTAVPVFFNVSVVDDWNRAVTGFDKENFRVLEDKVVQQITRFSTEDVPVSIGIVFSVSGLKKESILRMVNVVDEFFKTANPKDEFFLLQCDGPIQLSIPFTSVGDIGDRIDLAKSKQPAFLLDGIYRALSEMKNAKNPRKTLLVISNDWIDSSRHNPGEIIKDSQRADILIYSLTRYNSSALFTANTDAQSRSIRELLRILSRETGGNASEIDQSRWQTEQLAMNEASNQAVQIGIEIRNQYVIGYVSKNQKRDGKYRHFELKVIPPKGLPHLNARYRRGYFPHPD